MSKSFCVLPWLHLATHPGGQVSLCCESDHTNMASSAKTDDQFLYLNSSNINDIVNSDYFKKVRKEMLSGEIPSACTRCFMKEEKNIESKRVYENKRHSHFIIDNAIEITEEDGSIPSGNLEFVELRLGNVCNAKCRTCNPYSSSKWKKEYDVLQKDLIFLTQYNGIPEYKWPRRIEFWDELLTNKNISTIYINGGEPMMIKEHWSFIKRLVELDRAKDISLEYSINMTILPDNAVEIWSKFKNVRLMLSIDDLEDRNEYIRNPTKWDDVLKNLKFLKDGNLDMIIMQTVSVLNFYYIDEFMKWAILNCLDVTHNFVFDPSFLSPKTLPLNIRKKIIDNFKYISGEKKQNIIDLFYQGESPDNHLEYFIEYNDKLDAMRKEKFEDVFPEIFREIKNVIHIA